MNQATGNTPLDRQDTRVRHDEGVSGALRNFFDRVRSGDLGSLPVIVGLVIIWTVFQTLNPVFLSSNNLVNLLFDCSTIGVISLGIVCILMLGEIDLSVGSVSGLAYGSWLVSFGQLLVMPRPLSYALVLIAGLAIFFTGFRSAQRRREAGLSAPSSAGIALKAIVITAIVGGAVFYLNQSRGVPWMFGLFVALVIAMNYALTRTKWGRAMQAVGGNREAARRAGINVKFIYMSAFMTCSVLAAAGGILAASRLASSSQQAGTGDVNLNAIAAAVIGGTSLFGGRGSAWSALLGIIVIQSIASGLTLLDLSSSLRYMITGAVLAIAVIVDSLARRSRQSHGRA